MDQLQGSGEQGGGEQQPSRYRNFRAVQDVPPQKTLFLKVFGEVEVANPGIEVTLTLAVPQGINPHILLLDVELDEAAGFTPQVMSWKRAQFHSDPISYKQYQQVELRHPELGSHMIDVIDRGASD